MVSVGSAIHFAFFTLITLHNFFSFNVFLLKDYDIIRTKGMQLMIITLFENPSLFIISALALVVAITVHEFAHAKMADYLGDPTPRLQGRVTLNPKAHLDFYGTIFILLIGFGWGKPVQFDPYNLTNRRRDSALISIVGPLSNFAIALLSSAVLFGFELFSSQAPMYILYPLLMIIQLNCMLGIFNLIPVHPLDGFKIVEGVLPADQAHEWRKLERYGYLFLIMLIFPIGNSSLLQNFINPVIGAIISVLVP
jgi:Zn-dependent protease